MGVHGALHGSCPGGLRGCLGHGTRGDGESLFLLEGIRHTPGAATVGCGGDVPGAHAVTATWRTTGGHRDGPATAQQVPSIDVNAAFSALSTLMSQYHFT